LRVCHWLQEVILLFGRSIHALSCLASSCDATLAPFPFPQFLSGTISLGEFSLLFLVLGKSNLENDMVVRL
jgi:hypothetical protein